MAGGSPDNVHANQPATGYHLVSASSTNATSVTAVATLLTWYFLSNQAAAVCYVKLYDKASAPTVGTDTPKLTLAIPSTASANVTLVHPVQFTSGLAFAITTGPTDGDTGAVAANDVVVNLAYV